MHKIRSACASLAGAARELATLAEVFISVLQLEIYFLLFTYCIRTLLTDVLRTPLPQFK